jgi:hypothetical protein
MVASAQVSRVWGWASPDMFDSSPDPEARSSPECTRAIDHRRRFGRDVVGVREYEGQLVAVIAVDGPPRRTVGAASAPEGFVGYFAGGGAGGGAAPVQCAP